MEDNDSSGGRDQDLLAQEVTGDRSQGEHGEAWRDVILVLKACQVNASERPSPQPCVRHVG